MADEEFDDFEEHFQRMKTSFEDRTSAPLRGAQESFSSRRAASLEVFEAEKFTASHAFSQRAERPTADAEERRNQFEHRTALAEEERADISQSHRKIQKFIQGVPRQEFLEEAGIERPSENEDE